MKGVIGKGTLKAFDKLLKGEGPDGSERQIFREARQQGKDAYLHGKGWDACTYVQGTWAHHCWMAGFHQRVASEDQLYAEWRAL